MLLDFHARGAREQPQIGWIIDAHKTKEPALPPAL
jgi:hypothetical protein